MSIISYEATTLWLISNFQYVISALSFNTGAPFRKPFYTNILFTLTLFTIIAFDLALLFVPGTNVLNSPDVFVLMPFITSPPESEPVSGASSVRRL